MPISKFFPGSRRTYQSTGELPAVRSVEELRKVLHNPSMEQLTALNEDGAAIYYMVNETDGRGRAKSNVTRLRALWVDWDRSPPELSTLPIMPTYAVRSSPGKLQAVWVLEQPLDATPENVAAWSTAERDLVLKLCGDPQAALVTQVLRAPGFRNNKYPERPVAEMVLETGITYTFAALVDTFGLRTTSEHRAPAVEISDADLDPEDVRLTGWRRWLSRVTPPAEGGGERNGFYFRAAAMAVCDYALDCDDVIVDDLVAHSAQHHREPYDGAKLFGILLNARKHGSHKPVAGTAPKIVITAMSTSEPEAGPVTQVEQPAQETITNTATAPVIELAPRRQARRGAGEQLAEVRAAVNIAYNHAQHRFRFVKDDGGVLALMRIVGPGVLAPASTDDLKDSLILVLDAQMRASEVTRDVVPAVMARLRDEFHIGIDDVLPFVFTSEQVDRWAWARLPFDPDAAAECPAELKEILARTSEDEARSLILWIGSLLDKECPRTQYVHMHGNGNDGKSTLTQMLCDVFGRQFCATLRADDFKDSHSTTSLEQARLVIFHDENNSHFMSSGRFKELTGDAYISINPKGKARRTIRLHCRVIIASNNPPELTGTAADLRRIIPVHLRSFAGKNDPEFVARIQEKRYVIMQYCYAQWLAYKANFGTYIDPGEHVTAELVDNTTRAEAEDVITTVFDTSDPDARELLPYRVRHLLNDIVKNPGVVREAMSVIKSKYKIERKSPKSPRVVVGLKVRP